MLTFKVTYKLKNYTYKSNVYAPDKMEAIRIARLLARKGYAISTIEQAE